MWQGWKLSSHSHLYNFSVSMSGNPKYKHDLNPPAKCCVFVGIHTGNLRLTFQTVHMTHIQRCLFSPFCPGPRSIFSVVYFCMLLQEYRIIMICIVVKYQQKLRIKSEGLDPTPGLCQMKLLWTHYFPLVNSEIIVLLELIYLIIINEIILTSTDVCIDFHCKRLQAAERRSFLVSCVCTEHL